MHQRNQQRTKTAEWCTKMHQDTLVSKFALQFKKTAPLPTVFGGGACFFVIRLAIRTHRCVSNLSVEVENYAKRERYLTVFSRRTYFC